MATKKIIACLDIKDGRTVKGIHFEDIRDAGDPVQLGAYYAQQGADELVFLDISATNEKRKTLAQLAGKVAKKVDIPFIVGGGITSLEDVKILKDQGVDKVSINSAAVHQPSLITELARAYGSSSIIAAVDVKEVEGEWYVVINGGQTQTDKLALDWGKELEQLGAGEILLTSMNHDGTKEGFALDITRQFSEELSIPVTASGGAGSMQDFLEVFEKTQVSAALAAGIFHFKEVNIPELKKYLAENGVDVAL